jgi:hypothetical protein
MSEKSDLNSVIDDLFRDIEDLCSGQEPQESKMIGIWLPETYKIKFDELQRKTRTNFGKKIKDMIILAIDKVEDKI